MSDRCPICNSWTIQFSRTTGRDSYYVDCMRCGEYEISGFVRDIVLVKLSEIQVANVSGWIRENQLCFIDNELFNKLKKIKTPTVGEKAKKLFKYLINSNPVAGKNISLNPTYLSQVLQDINRDDLQAEFYKKAKKVLPWLSTSWAQGIGELNYILNDYLCDEKEYLTSGNGTYKITPSGWAYWNSLKYINIDSQMAFIAMWFDKTMDRVDKIIHTAVENAGYEPKRVDRHEHVNRIDDEIIALIRQSKFIVADYTGQRGGVYFESGFALGLGLPVIWLCKKEDWGNLHFDTNHYNFIFWEDDKLNELENALEKRIVAVLGKGNYNPVKE
ncbi:MAG: hypothetical protein H8E14_07440 [Candidatus Marinimicrobia bacterium]|nr:hypothetical protein [Candidatus Neomarinimicrobiota bacterium]